MDSVYLDWAKKGLWCADLRSGAWQSLYEALGSVLDKSFSDLIGEVGMEVEIKQPKILPDVLKGRATLFAFVEGEYVQVPLPMQFPPKIVAIFEELEALISGKEYDKGDWSEVQHNLHPKDVADYLRRAADAERNKPRDNIRHSLRPL